MARAKCPMQPNGDYDVLTRLRATAAPGTTTSTPSPRPAQEDSKIEIIQSLAMIESAIKTLRLALTHLWFSDGSDQPQADPSPK